jgi:drug/metabolite transporter (DMT)-like permease
VSLHAVSTDDDIVQTRISNTMRSNTTAKSSSEELMSMMTGEDIINTNGELSLVSTKQRQQFQDTPQNSLVLPGWFESAAWRGVIIVLCALWASNFAAAKLVMAEPGVDSSLYALSRFGVAAAVLAPFAIASSKRANMDWDTMKQALICGSWVAFGYLGQTLGLLTTTASKSCVICSMHCVFVAAVAELWRVQNANKETKFNVKRLIPAAIAVAGVAIVELKGAGGAPSIADALSFAQPVGFGMGYLLLENLMEKKPEAALAVSAIKLAVVAVASFLMFEFSPLIHGTNLSFAIPDFGPILSSPMALGGILYTGLITTALALWVESIAFAKVPATDASLILTTEPLFAAGCGAFALGETFGFSDYVGASLIVGACALSIFMDGPHTPANSGHEVVHPLVDP